ncbi:hypothetical protein [Deinococcus sp. Leaf326]|uniref:hypothetical protein n=1 Tax=Deinococcus sp. Leaf326 TaxID=1736338 RepID=UPI0006F89D88|nr:hypothetical protein [Deinococcus sp. Leaf326]KQR27263.1 hypothetical protein ASF71_17730 [Deinococcus sp. Leaf326]
MGHPVIPVRFFTPYGRVITTVNFPIPNEGVDQLPDKVISAANDAFGDNWGSAILVGMNLVIRNPKETNK